MTDMGLASIVQSLSRTVQAHTSIVQSLSWSKQNG